MIQTNMNKPSILIIGNGLVGNSLLSVFIKNGYDVKATTREDLNLLDYVTSLKFFKSIDPKTIVIFAAGISGGIQVNLLNKFKLYSENSLMFSNLLSIINYYEFKKFINILPSCIYPASLNHPAKISDLFTSPMEESSMFYSTAKIASYVGVTSMQNQDGFTWVNIICTNVYGEFSGNRKFDTHVIPQLIQKFVNAKQNNIQEVQLLGNGSSTRDFIFNNDLADAVGFFIENNLWGLNNFNISGGKPTKILSLAELISKLVNYKGKITLASSELNGTNYKVLDDSEFRKFGWQPKISLQEGLQKVIKSLNIV